MGEKGEEVYSEWQSWPIFHRLLRILNDNKNTVEDLKFDTEIAFPLIQSKVENILYLSH